MRPTRRTILAALGASAAWALVPRAASATSAVSQSPGSSTHVALVRNGAPCAAVLINEDANDDIVRAAHTLADYIEKSSQARIPVITTPAASTAGHAVVYLGFVGPGSPPGIASDLEGINDDGFVVRCHDNTVTVLGPTVWGTTNGVLEILERYVGVRWLLPGPDGEDVPRRSDVIIADSYLRSEPVFTAQRVVSPLHHKPGGPYDPYPIQSLWAHRNRLQGVYNHQVAFHHNLHTLFPVATFGKTHPEYYPNSTPPPPKVTTGWQPAFTVPGTIDAAVDGILKYFHANPSARSFSLGVNDSGGFAEPQPVIPYYSWVNQVVERVLAVHPDKWFGLLAYFAVEPPPPFPLHPRVVPFITKDRMAWLDPHTKESGQSLVSRWRQVASQLGFYDYHYGSPYAVPRFMPHHNAEVYRYAQQNQIIGQYAEFYPNWGEGPKGWIMARLLWNPNQDVDQLLAEWYERVVGRAAAPHLATYFRHWEDFWTTRVTESGWFAPSATWQPFHQASYLALVNDREIDRSRRALERAVHAAGTPPQRRRASNLLRAFEYYEASALSYPKPSSVPTNRNAAGTLLRESTDAAERRLRAAARRHELVAEFATDPVLVHPLPPQRWALLNWSGWSVAEFWSMVRYLKDKEPRGGPVTNAAASLATSHPSEAGRRYVRLILESSTLGFTVANGSFEQGTDHAPPWALLTRSTGTRTIARSTVMSAVGSASLEVTGNGWGGPHQALTQFVPGLAHFAVKYHAPFGTIGTIQLGIDFLRSNGALISGTSTTRTKAIPLDTDSGWHEIRLDAEIPASYANSPVAAVDLVVFIESASDVRVHLDDALFYNVPIPAETEI